MRVLDRKLFRDIRAMKGQVFAIAVVVAGGVTTYVMSSSTLDSLRQTQARFYREFRFAEAFCVLKRAPESVRARLQALPGVELVETRVVAPALLEVAGYRHPIMAQIVSLPDGGQPDLNRLYLKRGRLPEAGRDQEAALSEAFAQAHGLEPGEPLQATINGRRKRLEITGIVLAPEFIYQLQPGSIVPDFQTYAILWMPRQPLAAAFRMEGAFNDAALRLVSGARLEDVLGRVDEVLKPYGGLGAYGRKDQISHRYLSEEFKGLEQMATVFPVIFLGVAVFLLNVVLSRLMATERGQIAILKAFGYGTGAIVTHYWKLAVLIVLAGVAMGIAGGVWMGKNLSQMYMFFYRFPYLDYLLRPEVVVVAALVSAAAALAGTAHAVIRAAREAPAVAMQPASPARYRVSLVERLGPGRWLAQPSRMIVRNLERRPLKALLSTLGVAMSCGLLVMGGFFWDSVDYMVFAQFRQAQRDDLTVTFTDAVSRRALHSLVSLPGVEHAEGFRTVPARLRFEHRVYRTIVQGVEPAAEMRRLLDSKLDPVDLPPEGVLLTDYLAGLLGIQPGQMLTIEVLEGSRPVRQARVAGVVKEYIGVAAYMRLEALNRLVREGDSISGVYVAADQGVIGGVHARLKQMPRVAATSVRQRVLESFYETLAKQMLTFALFNTVLAASIAIGVVYNTARIALSERNRELASLRVLGYTRGEISYILLGELAVITLAAIPAGFVIGRGLCAVLIRHMQTDLWRMPLVIAPSTLAFAALVVLVAAALSGALVRRKLDHLDLVAVLKTKE